MVDYVFERHLSGGSLLPANKCASIGDRVRRERMAAAGDALDGGL